MEGSYSVTTNNRFAFFMDDEDDPGDMIVQPETKVAEKSPKTAETSPSQKKNDQLTRGKDQKPLLQPGKKPQGDVDSGKRRDNQFNEKGQQQNNKSNENRPPRENKRPFTNNSTRGGDGRPFRQNRGGRGRLPSREKQDGGEKTGGSGGGTSGVDDVTQRDARSRPRWGDRNSGEGRGRTDREDGGERSGGFRSSRPPRGGFRGGKREFERRSGSDKTSVKPFDKKEGAGSHNWGTVKDDINTSGGGGDEWTNEDGEQTEATTEQKEETTEGNDESGADKAAVEVQPDETVKEKEEELFTLDEYKAKQEKKRVVPVFKERKPGENEDSTRWKDTFVYERTDSELVPGTREIVEKYKSSGRVKTALEANFFFKDTSRFGRGGGPGKRGPERRQFDDRQGRQFDDRQGRQFDDRQGRQFEERQGRQFEERQGRQFEERQGRQFEEKRQGRQFEEKRQGRQFEERQGRQFEERQGRQFEDRQGQGQGQGQDERERRPRRSDGEKGDRERRPRRYDDDHRSERRGGGNRTRDRSKFNVEDEKDFPSLGTVSA